MKNNFKVYILLDNVRSCYNVGSIFRSVDAFKIDKIILTGITPTPENHKLAKTALGSEYSVEWEYKRQAWRAINELKKEFIKIISIENNIRNKSYTIFKFRLQYPVCLIFGNEIKGISPSILKKSNEIFSIPMHGKKESLNVSVVAGITMFYLNLLNRKL